MLELCNAFRRFFPVLWFLFFFLFLGMIMHSLSSDSSQHCSHQQERVIQLGITLSSLVQLKLQLCFIITFANPADPVRESS